MNPVRRFCIDFEYLDYWKSTHLPSVIGELHPHLDTFMRGVGDDSTLALVIL